MAEFEGGGIFTASNTTVEKCVVNLNEAGGIVCDGGSVVEANQCEIGGNLPFNNSLGGGITCSGGSLAATFCTITDNVAERWGGGLYTEWANATLENCIIWANTPDQANGWPPAISYSYVQGSWTGTGNIDADPQFSSTGCWHDSGTPEDVNDDAWIGGDYHLKSQAGRWDTAGSDWVQDAVSSLCIDAGNPGRPAIPEPLPNGDRANMGAYAQTPQASLSPNGWRSRGDITNDLGVDPADLAIFAVYWLGQGDCLPGDLDHDGLVEFDDLAILALDWSRQ